MYVCLSGARHTRTVASGVADRAIEGQSRSSDPLIRFLHDSPADTGVDRDREGDRDLESDSSRGSLVPAARDTLSLSLSHSVT